MSTVRIFVKRKAQPKQYVRHSPEHGLSYNEDVRMASIFSPGKFETLYKGTVDDFMRTGAFRHARGMECVNATLDHLVIGVETNTVKPEPVRSMVLIPKEG